MLKAAGPKTLKTPHKWSNFGGEPTADSSRLFPPKAVPTSLLLGPVTGLQAEKV